MTSDPKNANYVSRDSFDEIWNKCKGIEKDRDMKLKQLTTLQEQMNVLRLDMQAASDELAKLRKLSRNLTAAGNNLYSMLYNTPTTQMQKKMLEGWLKAKEA